MPVKLTGDWAKFAKCLKKMANLNFKSMHQEIGEALSSSARDRFNSGEGSDGKTWPRSRRAAENGGLTLTDAARLKNSISFRAETKGVAVGTNVRYALIHQYGGTITAKKKKYLLFRVGGRWVMKKSVTLPARPFIGLSREDLREIRGIVNRRIRKALKK